MIEKIKKLDTQKVILVVMCFILAGISIFLFVRSRHEDKASSKEQEAYHKIAQLIQLPEEKPVSVTVTDKAKLSNASLAERVENQDILLVFNQAKRLVVYRPSTGKVVDMLTFTNSSEIPTPTPQQ